MGHTRKKIKCHSDTDFRSKNARNCEDSAPKSKKYKPKSYDCPRRGCIPNDSSICGCHFYFNLENRPKHWFRSTTNEPNKLDNYNNTSLDNEYKSFNNKVNDDNWSRDPYVMPKCREVSYLPSRTKFVQKRKCPEKCSSQSNVRIGVTLVKEQTKYLMQGDTDCLKTDVVDQSSNGKNNKEDECSGATSTEEFIVEVHKDGIELKEVKSDHKGHVYFQEVSDQSPSVLDNAQVTPVWPKSESLQREILPFTKNRRNRQLSSLVESEVIGHTYLSPFQNNRNEVKNKFINHKNNSKENIKINFEKNNAKDKDITTDLNKQKNIQLTRLITPQESSTSLAGNPRMTENIIPSQNKSAKNEEKDNPIIHITRIRSRSCSPARTEETEWYGTCSSQYSGRSTQRKESREKIVIELSNNKNNTNYSHLLPNKEVPVGRNTRYEENISWKEISDELKLTNPPPKCYCYDCMCERISLCQSLTK